MLVQPTSAMLLQNMCNSLTFLCPPSYSVLEKRRPQSSVEKSDL